MAINQTEGKSVYASNTLEEHRAKSEEALYLSVREMVVKAIPDKNGVVVDLGCSDLVATGPLIEKGYQVVGLDLDLTALRKAREFYPNAVALLADVTAIPLAIEPEKPKIIVMLDILEHLGRGEAIYALREIRERMGNHMIIVSMPNISPFSIYTIAEGIKMIKGMKRPEKGLFDRTHQILTDIDGHQQMFYEAGYDVMERHVTTWDEGVTGDWDWKRNYGHRRISELKLRAYRLLAKQIAPRIMTILTNTTTSVALDTTTGYQGVYLLSPKK